MQPVQLSDGTGVLQRYVDLTVPGCEPRNVDVWLPPGYAASAERYPVVYLHDGQNLFDPLLSNTEIDWGVDEAVVRLMQQTDLSGAILVGMWCTAQRRPEYMPAKPLEQPTLAGLGRQLTALYGAPRSDAYLRWIVADLKPLIDRTYRTLPGPPSTSIMGSSMGGLISLYALSEYPAVFGAAACLSTHWPIGGAALVDAMAAALPDPAEHRIYFDYGSRGLDAEYAPFQQRMDAHMQQAGYVQGRSWLTRAFPGAEHNEAAWRARVELPLRFVLGLELPQANQDEA